MADRRTEERCVVILTALPVEYQAVRAHLQNVCEDAHPQGTVYERGYFSSNGQRWQVGLVETGSGNTGAAFEAERAIRHFSPELILSVGIAEGLKDTQPGDVVAATKVYSYEADRARPSFEPHPVLWHSTYRMEQRARAEARKHHWLRRISGRLTDPTPRVVVAPVTTEERGAISASVDTPDMRKTNYSDACAIETEGYGFLQAAHANQQVEALVIRGISALFEENKASHIAGAQAIAATHASAFAFEILAKLGESKIKRSTVSQRKTVPPQYPPDLSPSQSDAIALYFSYAAEDTALLSQLQKQLIMLKRSGLITIWYRDRFRTGKDKDAEQATYINRAHIILLLVSPHFLADEYTYSEATRAMQRCEAEDVVVIPIIWRPTTDWQRAAFGRLQSLPRTTKAIAEYSGAERERLIKDVATEIRDIVNELREKMA